MSCRVLLCLTFSQSTIGRQVGGILDFGVAAAAQINDFMLLCTNGPRAGGSDEALDLGTKHNSRKYTRQSPEKRLSAETNGGGLANFCREAPVSRQQVAAAQQISLLDLARAVLALRRQGKNG
jgi:hypothetical protein